MKLLIKQRFFTFLDNYDVYDETGRVCYVVEGQFAFGHHLKIYDAHNREVASIRQRLLTFLPAFDLYLGGQCVGTIHREFTFFKPRYAIDFNGWQVTGDVFEWDYSIMDAQGRQIATLSKELLNWTDTYSICVNDPKDALCALLLVVAIDAEKCSRDRN